MTTTVGSASTSPAVVAKCPYGFPSPRTPFEQEALACCETAAATMNKLIPYDLRLRPLRLPRDIEPARVVLSREDDETYVDAGQLRPQFLLYDSVSQAFYDIGNDIWPEHNYALISRLWLWHR